MECCHNNGNASDNRLENLRWDTHYNNNQDRIRHGTYGRGESHVMALITNEQAIEIYNSDEMVDVLSGRYGVSKTVITAIRRGHSWKDVTGGKPKPKRRPYGDRKTDKMNYAKAEKVRELHKSGLLYTEIAPMFGVKYTTISRICRGLAWQQ